MMKSCYICTVHDIYSGSIAYKYAVTYKCPKRDSIHRGRSNRLSTECEADALPPSHHGWTKRGLVIIQIWDSVYLSFCTKVIYREVVSERGRENLSLWIFNFYNSISFLFDINTCNKAKQFIAKLFFCAYNGKQPSNLDLEADVGNNTE